MIIPRLDAYCDQDVVTEAEIGDLLPPLSAAEREVWEFDQLVNDRGIKLDRFTIHRALAVREAAKRHLDAEITAITGGAVTKASQVQRLVKWINDRGVKCESIGKGEREELLLRVEAFGDEAIEAALDARIQSGQTSPTAKFKAMEDCMCADDRARGQYAYHAASTGRWAGRMVQFHNLYRVDPERDGAEIEVTLRWVMTMEPEDCAALLRMIYGSAMKMLAKITRCMIVADVGNKLVGADLSNIEGRLAAWFGNEQWKLDAFRAYDAKLGPDLYRVAYATSFGVPVASVTSVERQIGKVEELALGYQGSVGSFVSMAKVYGLKPGNLVSVIQAAAPDRYAVWHDRYAKARDKRGLPQDQWAAIKTIVEGWRDQHPGIVQSWWDCQDAAIQAVANPGEIVPVMDGKVNYLCARNFLWCRLPSGRVLAYCNPRVISHSDKWLVSPDGATHETNDPKIIELMVSLGWELQERVRRRVDYDGYDGEKRIWTSFALYGGMQFNHIVQGTARDVLVGGLLRCERAGYATIMHTHDEGLFEVPADFGSVAEVEALMSAGESWLPGCPLAAKGHEGARYSK